MTDRTWTGGAGTSVWTTANNWSPNDAAPAAGDNVFIGSGSPAAVGTVTNVTITNNCAFSGTSTLIVNGNFTINSGCTLTYNNNLTLNGNFTNNGTINASNSTGSLITLAGANNATADFGTNNSIKSLTINKTSNASITLSNANSSPIKVTYANSTASVFTFTAGTLVQNTQINCGSLISNGATTRSWDWKADVYVVSTGGAVSVALNGSGVMTFPTRTGRLRVSAVSASSLTFAAPTAGATTSPDRSPNVVLESNVSWTLSNSVNDIEFSGSLATSSFTVYGTITGTTTGGAGNLGVTVYGQGTKTLNIGSVYNFAAVTVAPLTGQTCTFDIQSLNATSITCSGASCTYNLGVKDDNTKIVAITNSSGTITLAGSNSTYNLYNVRGHALSLSGTSANYNCYNYTHNGISTTGGLVTLSLGTLTMKTGYTMTTFAFTSTTAANVRGLTFEDNSWIKTVDTSSTSAYIAYQYGNNFTGVTAPSNNCGFMHFGGGTWSADSVTGQPPGQNAVFNFYWHRSITYNTANAYYVRTLGNISNCQYECDIDGSWGNGTGALQLSSARTINIYGDLLLKGDAGTAAQWAFLSFNYPATDGRTQWVTNSLNNGTAIAKFGAITLPSSFNGTFAVGSIKTRTYTIGSVTVATTSGLFNCAYVGSALVQGAKVVVTGTPTSPTSPITNYATSKTYKISSVPTTTSFILTNLDGTAISTTLNPTTGLTFNLVITVDTGGDSLRCTTFVHEGGTVDIKGRFIYADVSYGSVGNTTRYLTTDDVPEIRGVILPTSPISYTGFSATDTGGVFANGGDIGRWYMPWIQGGLITVTGTAAGPGTIIGYTSGNTYKISVTNGSSSLTLVNLDGSPIQTTIGAMDGLRFIDNGAFTVNLANAVDYFTTAGGLVTVTGTSSDGVGIVGYTSGNTYKISRSNNYGGFNYQWAMSLTNLDNSSIRTTTSSTGLIFTLDIVKQAKQTYANPAIDIGPNTGIPWNHTFASSLYSNWRVWVKARGSSITHGPNGAIDDRNPSFDLSTNTLSTIPSTNPISMANSTGTFNCANNTITLTVGTIVTIVGTNTGTARIEGQSTVSGTWKVGTAGTTSFTLITLDGAAIGTTSGTITNPNTSGWRFTVGSFFIPDNFRTGSLRLYNQTHRNNTSLTVGGPEFTTVTAGKTPPANFTVNIINAAQYLGSTKGTTQISCDSTSFVFPTFNVSTAAKLTTDMSFKTLNLNSGANLITGGSTPNNQHICTGIITGTGGSATTLNASGGTWEIQGMTTSGTNQSGIWAGNLTTDNFRFEGNSSSILKFTGINGTGGGNYAECYLGFSTYGGKLQNNLPWNLGANTGDLIIYMVGVNNISTVNFSQVDFSNSTAKLTTYSTYGINIKGSTFNLGSNKTLSNSTSGTFSFKNIESNTIAGDYLTLSYSKVTGGAGWYAGVNTIDNGSNSGWIFNAPPTGSKGSFLLFFPI